MSRVTFRVVRKEHAIITEELSYEVDEELVKKAISLGKAQSRLDAVNFLLENDRANVRCVDSSIEIEDVVQIHETETLLDEDIEHG